MTPLIIAHALIDAVTFVGYAALVGKVSWLPLGGARLGYLPRPASTTAAGRLASNGAGQRQLATGGGHCR